MQRGDADKNPDQNEWMTDNLCLYTNALYGCVIPIIALTKLIPPSTIYTLANDSYTIANDNHTLANDLSGCIKICKEKEIRLSGPGPGRKKASEENFNKKQAYEDACARNAVESVFGVSKRKYCLDRIMAHLEETTKCLIAMNFFVLNMEKKLRLLFAQFLKRLFSHVFSSRISIFFRLSEDYLSFS